MTAKTILDELESSFKGNKNKNILIKEIKIKDNRALIKLVNDDDFRCIDGNFNVKDEINKKFSDLWRNSLDIFKELCPVFSKDLKNCTMNFIRFEYDMQNNIENVLFSVIYKFGASDYTTNINLPKIPIYKPDMDENQLAISGIHVDLLYDILDAAKAYMNGDTKVKQMKLIVNNED